MDIVVLSASPNTDGLTAACAAAAASGVSMAGGVAEEIRLNDLAVGACQACGNGWGTCRVENRCQVPDDFQCLHARVCASDGVVVVTPVYYGQMSESAKAFADRLRRCEATRGAESGLRGKPLIAVAAAGGGGGGSITCLHSMERWASHLGARVYDLIPVNQWTRPYKLASIREAGRTMVGEVG